MLILAAGGRGPGRTCVCEKMTTSSAYRLSDNERTKSMRARHMVVSVCMVFLAAFPEATAQLQVNADIMSRYIWRGLDFGNSPSFQPALTVAVGNLRIGTWGAYSVGAQGGSAFAEHDLWASYSVQNAAGTFTAIYTDYYYPSAGLKYFDYGGKGSGAHTLEVGLGYALPEDVPLTLTGYVNVHNDPDNSVYLQANYLLRVDGVSLDIFAGFTASRGAWYAASNASMINIGVKATRSVVVTESFSIPVSAAFIINPHLEQSYLTLGISF